MHESSPSDTRRSTSRPSNATVVISRFKSAGSIVAAKLRLPFVALTVSAWLYGCGSLIPEQDKIEAVRAVNDDFCKAYEQIMHEEGTRSFRADETQAFIAMDSALRQLGMRIEAQDSSVGYIRSVAPAPKPLTSEEWQQAAEKDLPRMHAIIVEHVGVLGYLAPFEPEGLEILINVTTFQRSAEVEVTASMRMRPVVEPKTGWPRRECPPPTAMRMGLAKFWSTFEKELERVQAIQ